MEIRELSVPGAFMMTPKILGDSRGAFLEWFRADRFSEVTGHPFTIAQANCSVSAAGTVRGVHFAEVPPSQAKYVTCPSGALLDVVVDVRRGSPTFGRWEAVRLDDENRAAVYVPEGVGHAFMLATCVVNGWDTATYLDPDHPLQIAIAETFADLTGEKVQVVAVDGCGAPLLSTSLSGLARAFRTVSLATEGPEKRVADAIRTHPEFTSGSRRDEATLLRAIPGAIGKAGAESCYAVGLADGRAVALKTDDGAPRVRPVLMAAALERLGVTRDPDVDVEAVRRTGVLELLGGGRPVGEIRATF